MEPDNAGAPPATPLDAERARLRAAGYTDAEISQILIARASAPQQAAGGAVQGAPPGVFSGTLGNVGAAMSYGRMFLPTLRGDLVKMFDRAQSPVRRIEAALFLAFKIVVIAAIGYAVKQEWDQHIMSATQTAANNSDLTAAQAKKMKAEADAAEQVAAGEKAKSCSERMQLLTQNMYMDDMNTDGTVKPGSRTARMMEKYTKECGGITGDTPDATSPDDPPKLTEAQRQDLRDCIADDADRQIRGCTGILDAFPHGYGKMKPDLMYFGRASGYRARESRPPGHCRPRQGDCDLPEQYGLL